MAIFVTRTTDPVFDVADEGHDFLDLEAAYKAGITAAAQIGADDIARGATVAMMEVCIENAAGDKLARGVVSLSCSRLSDG